MNQISNLPFRDNHNNGSNGYSRHVRLTTNLYEIRLDKLDYTYYKYDYVQNPQLALEQQKQHFRGARRVAKINFYGKIGFVCNYEDGFLGKIKSNQIIALLQQESIKIEAKLTKQVHQQEIIKRSFKQNHFENILKSMTKKTIDSPNNQNQKRYIINGNQIITFPKFIISTFESKRKLFMSINVDMKIKESRNVLYYLDKYDKQSARTILTNVKVIENYGSKQILIIDNIDYTKTPQSILPTKEIQKQCSFSEYYKNMYKISATNMKQPLLVAHYLKDSNKRRSIFLIPELVSLYQTINPSQNSEVIKNQLQAKKNLLPQEKQAYCSKIIKQLAENEIIKMSAHNLDGLWLKQPTILIEKKQYQPNEGLFDFRGRVYKPLEIKNWGIVYSHSKDPKIDDYEVQKLCSTLKSVCGQYGIKISNEPGSIQVKGDASEWIKSIAEDIKKFGCPQFMILFLKDEETTLYKQLKRNITSKFKFPCQVINRKLVQETMKKPYAVTADILFQIQAKIGGVPWVVNRNSQCLSTKKIMFGGVYITKIQGQYSLSFVGATSPQGCSFYSFNKSKIGKIDQTSVVLQNIFMAWAKNYAVSNRIAPETIITWGQFGCINQEKELIETSLAAIKTVVKVIGQKMKLSNYSPSISFISVSENTKLQIFSKSENAQNQTIIENANAGTVIIQSTPDEKYVEFYLNSKKQQTTTTRTTKFTIVEKGLWVSNEDLIELTHEQCYNYYNFRGAIQIPACLHYARKLHKFCQITQVQPTIEDKINKILYFI